MPLTEEDVKAISQRETEVHTKIWGFLAKDQRYFSVAELAEKFGFSEEEVRGVLLSLWSNLSEYLDEVYIHILRKDGKDYYALKTRNCKR